MTDDGTHPQGFSPPPGPPPRAPEPIGDCSNCHGPLWPGDDACRVCGRLIVQPRHAADHPKPMARDARWGRRGLAVVCALLVVLIAGATGLAIARWSAQQRAEAARQEHERQVRIHRSLHTLRANNPSARYALYPGDAGAVAFNTTFSTCLVRRVALKRSGSRVDVAVQLLGVKQDSQAPLVNVSLFDEGGNLLARAAIVKYVFSTLDQGETHDVTDRMSVPADSEPAIVGIDERTEGSDPPAPRSAARNAAGAYREQMDGLVMSLRDQGCEAYWPHKGRDDTLGVVVPDGGLTTREGRRETVRSICRRFFEIRRKAGRPTACRVVAQFEPSGYRFNASAR